MGGFQEGSMFFLQYYFTKLGCVPTLGFQIKVGFQINVAMRRIPQN